MKRAVVCFCVLFAAGQARAVNTVWKPAANGIYPPNTGNWNDKGNWTRNAVPGDYKVVFNVQNTAECVVTDTQSATQLVHGDNGAADAGVIRVKSGGNLTTGLSPAGAKVWSGIGYNRKATLIVETGGVYNAAEHLWIGFTSGGLGTLTLAGGTVSVAGMFGLGWDGGTGYVHVENGSLNLSGFSASRSIGGASLLDIEEGTVVIDGDQTIAVERCVAENKITAYGGQGTVLWDYDVTHPGKTTILATDATDEIVAHWHVVETLYPTDDIVITPFDAEDFGIVADGVTDVTAAIQSALLVISNLGGGALFLPAGHYKVGGTLTIPSRVTLRGDWQQPQVGQPISGTVLQAYAGRGEENGRPFIGLSGSSGVKGLTIWYPEQRPTNIQPYPPAIQRISGGNHTVENVTFVNAYTGFTTYQESITACPFLRHIYGTPLKTGIEYDCLADIGRMESVHFSPDYWKDSGLPHAPTADEHRAWIYENGTGVIVRRIDWSYSAYVTVEGYNIGFALRPSRYDGRSPNGQSYGFTLVGCKTGVYLEDSSYAGYQFTRFDIQQAQTGVYLGPSADQANMFHTCRIHASQASIFSAGKAKVLMMSCQIERGAVLLEGGYLSVINSDFMSRTGLHIELRSGVRGASILGNRFTMGVRIVDQTTYPVTIDHAALNVDPLPVYEFRKPTTAYRPARPDLYVVSEWPYSAQADGVTDDTFAFQSALNEAGSHGGGIVFVPTGTYRMDGNLIVPAGVELRGIYDIPHSTRQRGSLLNVYAGRHDPEGTPFIQIESGAGIRGLTFHYPEQIYEESDTVDYGMAPYPFLLRGLGSDIHVINVAATIPYQLLDLATHRCDRHYVDYILSTALKTGIQVGNGSDNGQIHNCQFNPSAYTHQGLYYDSIPTGTSDDIHQILWRDAKPYVFGHMSGEVLHENFVFGGLMGVHLTNEGGMGPSGHCLGMGADACTTALHVDAAGDDGLDMINSQIVSTNCSKGHYLETGPAFEDTFRMFSSAGWGCHEFSAVLNGGDVKLQLFHLARDGEAGVFKLRNDAYLQNLGGNLTDYLAPPRPFLTIGSRARAEFIGNIINTHSSQMPANRVNVSCIGNLRVR